MEIVEENPNVMDVTQSSGMLEGLGEANDTLDEISRGLYQYLELKRLIFPRLAFYHFGSLTLFVRER